MTMLASCPCSALLEPSSKSLSCHLVLWVHPTSPNPGSSTQELPSSSTGCVSPQAQQPGTREHLALLWLLHPQCPCHLADLLQGLPKGTRCSCYLSRIKQFLALSLWYFTNCASKTVCGNEQKTKPVNWSVLKITLWNKKYLIQTCLLKDWWLLFISVGPDPDYLSAETCIQFLCPLTTIQPIHFASHESTMSTRCRSPLSW